MKKEKTKKMIVKTAIEEEYYALIIKKKVILSSIRVFGAINGDMKEELDFHEFDIAIVPNMEYTIIKYTNMVNGKNNGKYDGFFVKYDYIEEETIWVPSEEDEIFIEC